MNDQTDSCNRRRVLQALGAAGVAGLAGCAGTGSNTPTSPPETDDQQTPQGDGSTPAGTEASTPGPMADSMEFWEMAGSYGGTMDRYSQQTGTEISHTNMGYSELVSKLQTRLISGQGAPTTALLEQKKTLKVASTGGLRDLRPRMEAAGIVDQFSEGHLNAVTDDDDGAIYSVPDDAAPTMLYYRRDVWDEHGLAPHEEIETWDQLIEEGQKLPEGVSLLSLPASNSNLYWRFLNRMQGGQEFDADGNIVLNGETGLMAARTINKLAEAGLVDRVSNWSQPWFTGFQEGTITGYATGSWFQGTLRSNFPDMGGQWRGFKLPALEQGGNRASNRGGSGLVIPTQLSDAQANRAWDFIQFTAANKEQNAEQYANEGQFTAHAPSWELEAFDQGIDYFGGQTLGQFWTEQMPNVPGYRFTIDSPAVSTIINEEMRNMVDEGDSPKTVMDRAAQRLAERTGRSVA